MWRMHTIELSREGKADEALVIPAHLLTPYIGTHVRITVELDDVMNEHNEHDDNNIEPDDELLAIVKRIQSRPPSPEHIKRATKRITQEELDELLARDRRNGDPDFDAAAWNAQWAVHEAEMKELEQRKEQQFLEEMARLFE